MKINIRTKKILIVKFSWNFTFIWLTVFVLASCSPRPILAPHHKIMHQDPYGSAIQVTYIDKLNKRNKIEGEIIGVQNDTLVLLTLINDRQKAPSPNVIQFVERIKIHSYTVYYSKIRSSRIFPFSSIFIPLHGYFMIFSIPINFAVFLSAENGEKNYFSMNHKKLPFEKLHLYSRFPQGIPSNIDVDQLKSRDYQMEKSKYGY